MDDIFLFALPSFPLLPPSFLIGALYEAMGDNPSALQQHSRVLSVYERELPSTHPIRIAAMGNKASALSSLHKLDNSDPLHESLALFKAALKLGRRVF